MTGLNIGSVTNRVNHPRYRTQRVPDWLACGRPGVTRTPGSGGGSHEDPGAAMDVAGGVQHSLRRAVARRGGGRSARSAGASGPALSVSPTKPQLRRRRRSVTSPASQFTLTNTSGTTDIITGLRPRPAPNADDFGVSPEDDCNDRRRSATSTLASRCIVHHRRRVHPGRARQPLRHPDAPWTRPDVGDDRRGLGCRDDRLLPGQPTGTVAHFGDADVLRRPARAPALNHPIVGIAQTGDDGGLLARGDRRRHLQLRRRPVLRLGRRASTQQADRRAWRPPSTAAATGWSRPTAGIFSYGDAQFYGSTGACTQQADRRHGADARRRRLLAGRLRRRHLRLRRRPRSSARPAAIHLNKPIVGMAADARRRRLLAGGLRRRHLRLRRRPVLRLDRESSTSTSPSWAWPRCPTAPATGSPPPTAASSTTGTRPSSAPRPARASGPSSAWPPSGAPTLQA